jgi:hypothetical protein
MLSDAELNFDDPEFPNEDDPVFEAEVFAACQYLGWKPEALADRAFAARYAVWLKSHYPMAGCDD